MAYVSGIRHEVGVCAAIVASLLLFASTARAQEESDPGVQVELGVMGGYEIFAHNLELGVADDPALPSPKSNGLFGARAALAFNRSLSLEIEGVGIPTGDSLHNYRLFVVGWRAHVLWHIPVRLLDGKLRPFVLAGVGALSVVDTVGTDYDEIKKDTDFAFHGGVGVKYAFTTLFSLRLDGRVLGARTPSTNGYSPDCEVMAGLGFTLGGHARRAATAAPARAGQGQRQRRHPRRRGQVPERRGQGRPEDEDGCPDKPTTTATASSTARTSAPTRPRPGRLETRRLPRGGQGRRRHRRREGQVPRRAPRTRTASRTTTAARIRTTTRTASPTRTTSARTSRRPRTATRTRTAAPTRCRRRSRSSRGVVKGINFRRNSADIKASSFPLLKEAVKVVQGVPGAAGGDLRPHLRRGQARVQHEAVAASAPRR